MKKFKLYKNGKYLGKGTTEKILNYIRNKEGVDPSEAINSGLYKMVEVESFDIDLKPAKPKANPITSDDQIDFHNWINNLDRIPEKMAHKTIKRTAIY